jgi:hypothetical protein
MNIPFAFCLTPAEYRRAVHSLRLDTSLLTVLTALTGDSTFLAWRPEALPVRVDSNVGVPAMVYEHAARCEYAHARLCQLRDAARRDGANGGSAAEHGWAPGHADRDTPGASDGRVATS